MRMLIGSMLALMIALSGPVATAHTVRIVGYLEDATILPIGLAMKAKMDTGADITLIHAVEYRAISRGRRGLGTVHPGRRRSQRDCPPTVGEGHALAFRRKPSRRAPDRTAWAVRCRLLQAYGGYPVRSVQDEHPLAHWQALHAFGGASGRSCLGERRPPDLRLSAEVLDREQQVKAASHAEWCR